MDQLNDHMNQAADASLAPKPGIPVNVRRGEYVVVTLADGQRFEVEVPRRRDEYVRLFFVNVVGEIASVETRPIVDTPPAKD